MQWTSALAIYFIIWFFCLFLVLPFHAAPNEGGEAGVPGADRGAPAGFAFGRAAMQVTLLSALLFGLYYANYVGGWLTRADLGFLPQPPAR